MLRLQHLSIIVSRKEIIRDVDIDFPEANTTIILGQNGSGKTSLALAIA
jgi:Fe-S cluster assembly ATPase SufC